MSPASRRAPRVLAIASPGGHWVQLRRLARAWEGCEVAWACAGPSLAAEVAPARYHAVPDASRRAPLDVLRLAARVALVLLRERPDVVVTTGAAPGGLAVALGRLLGARTVWIDSVANVERLSLSGRLFGRLCHLWLTQWPHLARRRGPRYRGALL